MNNKLMQIYRNDNLSLEEKYVAMYTFLTATGFGEVANGMKSNGITTLDNIIMWTESNDSKVTAEFRATLQTANPQKLYYDVADSGDIGELRMVDDFELDMTLQNAIIEYDSQQRVHVINNVLANAETTDSNFNAADFIYQLYVQCYEFNGTRNLKSGLVYILDRIIENKHLHFVLDDNKYNNFELGAFITNMPKNSVTCQSVLDYQTFDINYIDRTKKIESISNGETGTKGVYINDNDMQRPISKADFQKIIKEINYKFYL